MKLKTLTQTFNDGVLSIFKVENIAESGNMPKDGLVLKYGPLRYEERIVGITRNTYAMQSQSSIEQLLRIQRIGDVSVHDVVILSNGSQFDVYQAQYINDTEPRCIDLSLTRLEVAYEFTGI